MSLHIDGAEGARWTKILAGTTAYTLLLVHHRNQQYMFAWNLLIVGIQPTPAVLMNASLQGNHLDSLGRTMAGTVATGDTICHRHTVVFNPNGMTHLNGCLLLLGNGLYGSCWADITASCTFRSAIATFVAYFGLHKAVQAVAGSQHIVGAAADTQLARGTMFCHISDRQRAWRGYQLISVGFLFILDFCQSAVRSFLLCLHQCCSSQQSHTSQNGTTVDPLLSSPRGGIFLVALAPSLLERAGGEAYCLLITHLYTITTCNATAVVNLVCLGIDAGSLAVTLTLTASVAGIGVDGYLHTGILSQNT